MSESPNEIKTITTVLGAQTTAATTLAATGQKELALVMVSTIIVCLVAVTASRLATWIASR